MNGLTLIFQSLSQAIGPIILGTSMSLSLQYNILSHELCFVILFGVNIFACYIDSKLDFPNRDLQIHYPSILKNLTSMEVEK